MAKIKLIGSDDQTSASSTGANYIVLDPFECVASGSCVEIRVKVFGNTNVKVAIYADSAGSPGNRIAKFDAGQACVEGWNTITLESPVNLTLGTNYWLAYIEDGTKVMAKASAGVPQKYKAQAYAGYAWEATLSGLSGQTGYYTVIAGWGTLPAAGGAFLNLL